MVARGVEGLETLRLQLEHVSVNGVELMLYAIARR